VSPSPRHSRPVIYASAFAVLFAGILGVGSAGADPPATWVEVEDELALLATQYPELVNRYSLGETWEGRTLWGIRISDDQYINESLSNLTPPTDPAILYLAAQHGDEPQGVDLTLTLANDLLSGYGTDPNLTALVKARDIWIIPVANPDGYFHDHRKNARDNNENDRFDPKHDGVDLNRNFAYEWGVDSHTSADPDSDNYHGPDPFSEPESRALENLSRTIPFLSVISYHSGTPKPVIYYPWGCNDSLQVPAGDLVNFTDMASNLSAMTGYRYGQATDPDIYGYEARGDLADWLYANHSTLAFTIELPGRMTSDEIEANLEAALWLLARPWGNETEGPLGNLTGEEPELEPEAFLPDAWVEDVRTNGPLVEGDQVSIVIWMATAPEAWPKPRISVTLLVNHATLATVNTSPEMGGNTTVTFVWVPDRSGAYVIEVLVDPWNRVEEANETNNSFKFTITIGSEHDDDQGLLPGPGIPLIVVTVFGLSAVRINRKRLLSVQYNRLSVRRNDDGGIGPL